MCDQNALLRFLAAQATAQQQMAFGRQTAAPQRALGGPMMGPMLGMNPFVAPEMMLWQSMMAAQAQAQMAQLQQQQAQSQPSFDEVLKKLAESAKTADKDKSNAHSSQIPSTSGATATAIAKEEIRLEPGEIPKPMRSASKHTAMNKTMLDTAMWQLLASQLLQQQASLKMNGHPVRSSKKEVSTSVNSGVLDLSGKNISEPGPSSSGTDTRSSATPSEGTLHWENNKKRPPATENQARLPLKLGWRRQTCIRSINASGVRGDVVYYAPCGKKLSTYAEVLRYLMKNNCGNITRDNFSFSSKLVVGEFLMPKESAEGEKLIIKMTEDDINEEMNKLFRLKPLPRIADKKTRDERVSPEEAIDHFEEAEGAYDDEEKIKWSREPIDDLLLTEIRPLPDLPRINNLQLSGTGFADALMVYEFVHNFAHVLAIDSSSLPTLESFCTYLAGETENCSEVLQLTETLFRLTLEYPGLPSGKKGMTKLGQSISDVGIKKNNYSELMRLFLASRDSQGIKLSHLLSDSSFECLGGEDKAAILAFLCNELLCCPNIVAEIDRNLDEVGRLKGDRWMRDGKARALRVVQKKKEKIERAHLEECEGEDRPPSRNSEGSDGSRPGTPVPHRDKKLTPGLGQCEILTEEEENMSPEELENLIRSLNLESTFLKEKINILTMKVRSFPFGTDRFHRQYWQLPHVPAVLVESVESAGVTNPACNADQICGKDPQGVSGSHFIDPDVAACIEDVIDEVVAAKVHGDRKRRKRIRRMENTFKRGWWTIDTRESLEAIRSSLHGRGIRERALHRLLCKNWFLNDVKLGRVSVDVVVHETNREEIANSEIEIVHKELNSLYEKIREAGVQNKYNESLIKTDADVKSLEHNLTYGNRQIAFRHLKQAIVACEHSIDRSYLRPSFCIGDRRSIAYTLKMEVKNRVEEHVDDEEHPYERDDSERDDEAVEEGEKDEIDRRETIERWRSYVYESTTTAQMIIAIQMLHSCIAWERSTVLNLCQICRTRCNEEEVQCKKCGLGFHVKCLKIPTPCSFAQWNCAACIELSSGHPTCMICCRQDSTSRPCRKCYNFFHVDCSGESTISPQMEYICTGCDMKQFERKVILRGESEERAEMEETVEVEHQKEPKRAPKRKSEAPPPIVFPTDMNSDLCRAMLDEMEAQPVVGPFMEPVDLDLVTGYREAIANPIDISTIRNRIDAQCYESPEDFASDVELMFSNCRTFNEDESPVGIAGATLHKFYQKRWRQLKYNFSKRLKRMRPSV